MSKKYINKKDRFEKSRNKNKANKNSKKIGFSKRSDKEIKIIGTLSKHRKGFGFIKVDNDATDGREQLDIFVSPAYMSGAMDKDVVEAVLLPKYEWKGIRPEARVTKIVEHATKEIVGTFIRNRKAGYVIPNGKGFCENVFVPANMKSGAETGDSVVIKITKYPFENGCVEGRVVEIIARKGEAGADIKSLIRSAGFRNTFPSRASAQAKAIGKAEIKWDNEARRDLRDKQIFTIDGKDSKDFDDAVSIDILDNGNYLLGVHIADVSEYVTEDSPLDVEALKRGTSVYVMNNVVPMLPRELSNNICSLNPNVDRLTLSVDMEVTTEGKVVSYDIYESVICSKARLVYDDVSDIIEKDDPQLKQKYSYLYDDIMRMAKLASILGKNRKKRGSLDFEFDEAYIQLDEEGIPISINLFDRRTANRLIEEFMLLANETIAMHFATMEVPFVYRVHERPDVDRIEELKSFLKSFSINLQAESSNIHSGILAKILEAVSGETHENVVSVVMLRSMKKATYEVECLGHFALSLKYYCHFTSPIRRYPDLIIHRIIKECLKHGMPNDDRLSILKIKACNAAQLSTENEKRAVDLERDAEKMKKAEYMTYHIGETYEGIISGITNYGIYVELPNTIEGMVRLESITDDYYTYEPTKYRIIGNHFRKIYTLGQKVTIKVIRASAEDREIDFELA